MVILYEESCFSYIPWQSLPVRCQIDTEMGNYLALASSPPAVVCVEFPFQRFNRIRKLHLIVEEYGVKEDSLHFAITPKMVTNAIRYFTAANCSPKRLVLELRSHSDGYEQQLAYKSFGRDQSILAALSAMNILEEIQIKISDQYEARDGYFQHFIHSIMVAKGWICYRNVNIAHGNRLFCQEGDHVHLDNLACEYILDEHYTLDFDFPYGNYYWYLRPKPKSASRSFDGGLQADSSKLTIAEHCSTSSELRLLRIAVL